jgi:hypothetical protein
MKFVICIYFFLSSSAFAQTHKRLFKQEVKSCLASAYAAEKSYYIENDHYTEDVKALNLAKMCSPISMTILTENDAEFIVHAEYAGHDWIINEMKVISESL